MRLLSHEIQAAELNLVAELAKTQATVEELLAMQVGDFIELDRLPAIQAKVEGVPLFNCQYGAQGQVRAAHRTQAARFQAELAGNSYVN